MSKKEHIEEIVGVVVDNQVSNEVPDYSDMSPEDIIDKIRESRKSLSFKNALATSQRPGFIRRLVTDRGNQIQEKIALGWAPVRDTDAIIKDGRIQSGTQIGALAKKIVNPNHPSLGTHGILMEIPEAIYKEDQLKKYQKNKEKLDLINQETKRDSLRSSIPLDELYGEGLKDL